MSELPAFRKLAALFLPMHNFDLYSQAFKRNPYPTYDEMRALGPLVRNPGLGGGPIWFVTGFDVAQEVLRDHKRFVKDWRNGLTPEQLAQQPPPNPISDFLDNHLLNLDPPDHTRIRSLVNKVFTARRVEGMRPRIQQIADELLDAMEGNSPTDLIDAYAFPLPITVIAELLGVPASDQDKFRRWSNAAISPVVTEEEWQQTLPQLMEFMAYLSDMFRERRTNPQDDLISALVQVEEDGDKLQQNELYGMIFILLIAGHETTVNLIANSVLALIEHPEQMAELIADPALMPKAIDELLRFDNPVERALMRWVSADFTFHGHELKRGESVIVVLGGVNHDPAHFGCPAHLDIHRENNKHMSFGMGIHYCLGAPLARVEGEIALNSLLARLNNLRLAVERDDLVWRENPIIRGVETLPVAWD